LRDPYARHGRVVFGLGSERWLWPTVLTRISVKTSHFPTLVSDRGASAEIS
jgi:hypothetical protein